ncbi:hypothetical protein BKA63DRAFT_533940 [Paraphoma chrysanthemicola]|nr:hypothetical protein BKA63DRAFT_533940 [Paraphoma chrysanthemicola]
MSIIRAVYNFFEPIDYTISTWLTIGATIQTYFVLLFPRNIALLPPIALLLFRFISGYLIAKGTLPNSLTKEINHGRTTWQIPTVDGTVATTGSRESITVLVLAAQKLNDYFGDMWRDASENRDKFGFLGNTPAMNTPDDGERQDTKGRTSTCLSYWKSLSEGLHKFAHAINTGQEEFPRIGTAHELYEVPAGNWENIYSNYRPGPNVEYPVPVVDDWKSNDDNNSRCDGLLGYMRQMVTSGRTCFLGMGRQTVFDVAK